jgi:hypothetical protein
MTLEERLAAKLAKHGGKGEQRVRDRCKARLKAANHDPEDLYRCVKEARHEERDEDRHEDDFGSQWVTRPEFKVHLRLGP